MKKAFLICSALALALAVPVNEARGQQFNCSTIYCAPGTVNLQGTTWSNCCQAIVYGLGSYDGCENTGSGYGCITITSPSGSVNGACTYGGSPYSSCTAVIVQINCTVNFTPCSADSGGICGCFGSPTYSGSWTASLMTCS
jgi:hypothetical protein